jgi:branched-subunit amino acid aminotransferase/4-amino-4-deoxychorismate lyase
MRGERELDPERLGDHIDRLYRAAWGLCGSREDAEDLVQETLALVLRKPRFLRSDDDVGYLLRVLRNTFSVNGARRLGGPIRRRFRMTSRSSKIAPRFSRRHGLTRQRSTKRSLSCLTISATR